MRFPLAVLAVLLASFFATRADAQERPTVWVGAYQCNQRVTGLTLTLTTLPQHHLEAVFDFYSTPINPDLVTRASFSMTGTTDESGRSVTLHAGNWISPAPRGYNPADFQGEISADGELLLGNVMAGGAACGAAALVRGP